MFFSILVLWRLLDVLRYHSNSLQRYPRILHFHSRWRGGTWQCPRNLSDHLVHVHISDAVRYLIPGDILQYIIDRLRSVGALRTNISFIALFAFLTATFAVLAAGQFTAKATITQAGGAFGIITAVIAYYCALSELLVKEESFFTLPLGKIFKEGV